MRLIWVLVTECYTKLRWSLAFILKYIYPCFVFVKTPLFFNFYSITPNYCWNHGHPGKALIVSPTLPFTLSIDYISGYPFPGFLLNFCPIHSSSQEFVNCLPWIWKEGSCFRKLSVEPAATRDLWVTRICSQDMQLTENDVKARTLHNHGTLK